MGNVLVSFMAKFLVFLFFAGIIGSAIVVIVTFIEDGKLLLESDERSAPRAVEDHHFPPSAAAQVGD